MLKQHVIVPKAYIPDEVIWPESIVSRALYFLIGPVRGGGDWQHRATREIFRIDSFATVAVPCRWTHSHPLASHFLTSEFLDFDRQLTWERYLIERAGLAHQKGRAGCIVVYLPLESTEDPHPGPEPYAMDTRGELGEWRMRMKFEGAKLVMGAHPDFHGLSQIKRNFSAVLGYDFPVYESLEETVRAAHQLAYS